MTSAEVQNSGWRTAWRRLSAVDGPLNPVDHIVREWGLTEGQARGVLYAQASRTTLNRILKHRRGGLKLWLEIIAEVTGERLENFIEKQANEARRERERWEAEERIHEARLARLAELGGHRGLDP